MPRVWPNYKCRSVVNRPGGVIDQALRSAPEPRVCGNAGVYSCEAEAGPTGPDPNGSLIFNVACVLIK